MGFETNKENINYNGRPKKGESLKELFEKVLEEEYVRTKEDGTKEATGFKKKEILTEAIFRFAVAGSATHANIIFDRVYGRVPYKLESTGIERAISMTDEQYNAIMDDIYKRQNKWSFDENGNPIKTESIDNKKMLE